MYQVCIKYCGSTTGKRFWSDSIKAESVGEALERALARLTHPRFLRSHGGSIRITGVSVDETV